VFMVLLLNFDITLFVILLRITPTAAALQSPRPHSPTSPPGAAFFLSCSTMDAADAAVPAASLSLPDPRPSCNAAAPIQFDVYGELARASSSRSLSDMAAGACTPNKITLNTVFT